MSCWNFVQGTDPHITWRSKMQPHLTKLLNSHFCSETEFIPLRRNSHCCYRLGLRLWLSLLCGLSPWGGTKIYTILSCFQVSFSLIFSLAHGIKEINKIEEEKWWRLRPRAVAATVEVQWRDAVDRDKMRKKWARWIFSFGLGKKWNRVREVLKSQIWRRGN